MSSLLRPLFCFLARLCILRHKPFVIGITGSFGKTTARHIITEILKRNNKNVWTAEGNYNGEWGLALSVLQVRSGGKNIRLWLKVCKDALYTILKKEYPDILVLEYGIDHTGEMRIQTQIVEPDIALFTTLSPSHLDGFASVEEYYAEKQKLLCRKKKNTFAIGNKDDIHQAFFDCQMWYGHSMSDITFSNIEEYIDTTTAVVHYQGVAYTIQTPILGGHHIGLIAGSILVALQCRISISDSIESLKSIDMPYGRGNILQGINNTLIIDGTYNGGFEPMLAGVKLASRLADKSERKMIALLGDMRELGDQEVSRHQELWNILRNIAHVQYVFVGKVSQNVIAPMLTREEQAYTSFFVDAREAGKYIQESILNADKKILVFAKGSQNTIYLEEAIKYIILPQEGYKIIRQDPLYSQKKEIFWKTIQEI